MGGKVFGIDKALQDIDLELDDSEVHDILEGAANIALPIVQQSLNDVLSGESTGTLENSIGISTVKMNRKGVFNIKIGFAEFGSGTMTNAAKAANLEYGNSRGQPKRPWLLQARRKVKNPVEDFIKRAVEDKIKK